MPRKAMLIAALLTLTGCIGVPTKYVKAGASDAQFYQDRTQCTYEARLHQPNDPFMWPDVVSLCLQARGWQGVRQ